mgnify:CR=1 FL=1
MNKTNGKLVLYAVMVLFGVGLFAFSVVHKLDGVYGGLGGGLAGAGIAQIVRILRYKNNKEYAKRVAVENADERNVYLAQKAKSAAFVYGVLLCAAASVAAFIMNMRDTGILLSYVICGFLVLNVVFYRVYKRKY